MQVSITCSVSVIKVDWDSDSNKLIYTSLSFGANAYTAATYGNSPTSTLTMWAEEISEMLVFWSTMMLQITDNDYHAFIHNESFKYYLKEART